MQNQNTAFQMLRECGYKHQKIVHAIRSLREKKEMLKIKMKIITSENKETGRRKGKVKLQSRHKNSICLACMKQCHYCSNQGIWMPHTATKHRGEQKDTHGVLQTAGLSGAVHTKAAPALPPCTSHDLA